MDAQPTLMLIADIAGYTKFMKFHQSSLAHAQETVARLLEVVIDAAGPSLRLAKLEGDAAFFYMPAPKDGKFDSALVAGHAAAIYRAFHMRAADLQVNTLCPCDGCQQSGNLKIKLVGHLGGVAMQRVKQMTELAGVDEMVGSPLHERAAPFELDLDDIGPTQAYYLDLTEFTDALPPPQKLPAWRRLARHSSLGLRTLPRELGLRKSCTGFRNVPDAR